jgi:hypothetical protein
MHVSIGHMSELSRTPLPASVLGDISSPIFAIAAALQGITNFF